MPEEIFSGTTPAYTQAIHDIIRQSQQTSERPYQGYPDIGELVAPFSPMQQEAFKQIQRTITDPRYAQLSGQALSGLQQSLQSSPLDVMHQYLRSGVSDPTQSIDKYMNPYQQRVIDSTQRQMQRRFEENILPRINADFISRGAYQSGKRGEFARRALRDLGETMSDQTGRLLQEGFGGALNQAQRERERMMQAGHLSGMFDTREAERQMLGASQLQSMGERQRQQELANAGMMQDIGSQQQQMEQTKRNLMRERFEEERAWPYQQLARHAEIVRGMPITTQVGSKLPAAAPPQPSGAAVGSQMLGQMAGLLGRMQNPSRPGFADGGPVQYDMNPQVQPNEYEQKMKMLADSMSGQQHNPLWNWVTGTFGGMGHSQRPTTYGRLMEGSAQGVDAFNQEMDHRDDQMAKAASLNQMLAQSQQIQQERLFNRQRLQTTDEMARLFQNAQMHHMGMKDAEIAARLKAFEESKGEKKIDKESIFFDKESGQPYQFVQDDSGKIRAQKLEGYEGEGKRSEVFKKANEEAAQKYTKVSGEEPAFQTRVQGLMELNEKLNTAPYVGKAKALYDSDYETFDKETSQLAQEMMGRIRNIPRAYAALQEIMKAKPGVSNYKETNRKLFDFLLKTSKELEERAEFVTDNLKRGINAYESENAFNRYLNDKYKFKPEVDLSPYDYLNGETSLKSSNKKELSMQTSIPKEERQKQILEGSSTLSKEKQSRLMDLRREKELRLRKQANETTGG